MYEHGNGVWRHGLVIVYLTHFVVWHGWHCGRTFLSLPLLFVELEQMCTCS